MKKKIIGYKWITDKNKSSSGNISWKKGIWQKHTGKLELCQSGFHASRSPLQSLEYIYGDNWWVVEARGRIKEQKDDKFTCSEMRIIKRLPVKKILVKFAIKCARRCLKNFEIYNSKDKRPRKAIEAAERYIENPTEKNRKAAGSAARSAESAAESAESAARLVARLAASSVAWSAAWSARSEAMSAESAAELAELKWQEKTLKDIVKKELGLDK